MLIDREHQPQPKHQAVRGYCVHTSLAQPQNAAFCPIAPNFGGTSVQNPSESGDLGGGQNLCVHGSFLYRICSILSFPG